MKRLTGLAGALTLILSACATSTPYGPAPQPGGYGFSEQQIEQNRYRITFRGNSSTSRQDVESFLLYRAAELTVQNGYDYFITAEYDTEANKRYTATSYYPAYYGRYHYRPGRRGGYYAFPYYAYGFDWGYPHDLNIREVTRYSAVAYITMHKGSKPVGETQAFDAREVIANLQSQVISAQP